MTTPILVEIAILLAECPVSKLISLKDLEFLLYRVFNAEQLTGLPHFADHDRTTFDGILTTAGRIAQAYFAPHNSKADEHEPQFDGKTVTTIPEVKEAWQHFAKAGLLNARHAYGPGGIEWPCLVPMGPT